MTSLALLMFSELNSKLVLWLSSFESLCTAMIDENLLFTMVLPTLAVVLAWIFFGIKRNIMQLSIFMSAWGFEGQLWENYITDKRKTAKYV